MFDVALAGGTWYLDFSADDLRPRNLVGPSQEALVIEGLVSVVTNDVVCVVRRATATITGKLQNTDGNGIENVGISGSTMINGTNYFVWQATDADGRVLLPVCNAGWDVSVSCGGEHGLQAQGYECVASQSVTVTDPSGGTVNFIARRASATTIATSSLPDGLFE